MAFYMTMFLGIYLCYPLACFGQDSIWDYGTQPLGAPCIRYGFDPLGVGLEDPWIINAHCMTFNGSAWCDETVGPVEPFGICVCNQGDDAHFDYDLLTCVGKVDAICNAEHSEIFPDKLCTPNADCVPIQSQGRSVGKCECVYGYKSNEEGMCIVDPDIGEGERSTPRTTTTTESSEKEDLEVPWDLIIDINFVEFGDDCHPTALLNRTYCNSYSGTVACLDNKCHCIGKNDAYFEEELSMCVGLVGSYCLGRGTLLGYRICTFAADCVLENGRDFENGYSFGTCQCLYGYKETGNRTCERDENIEDPSTPRTIPTTIWPTTIPTTTPLPSECPPDGVDKIPHPSNCSLYYVCVNGAEYEQECGEGLHYNPILKECDFPENVNCTKPLPDCPPDGVSFHPYPGNCSLYVICAEGTPVIQMCAPGTCFDPEELKCLANDTGHEIISYDIPYHVPENRIREQSKSKCNRAISDGLVLVAGYQSFEEFVVCHDGKYKATFRCQEGTCFDETTQSCTLY